MQTARPVGRRRSFSRYRGRLQLHDVLSGGALLALNHFELDSLAFGQGLEAILLDRGVMHEAVLFAVLGRDEPEAVSVVEPVKGTGEACHTGDTPDLMFATARGFRFAAGRGLVLPPSLSGPALIEALPLQVLEQSGPGDLPAELLQDPVQSVVLAQRDFHRPRSRREAHQKLKKDRGRSPGPLTVTGVQRSTVPRHVARRVVSHEGPVLSTGQFGARRLGRDTPVCHVS